MGGPWRNRLDFGGDPDSFVDPGSRSTLPLADRALVDSLQRIPANYKRDFDF